MSTAALLAGGLVSLAVGLSDRRPRGDAARRLRALHPSVPDPRPPGAPPLRARHRSGPTRLLRARLSAGRDRDRAGTEAALAVDLLAACLVSGAPLERAVGSVAVAVGGEVSLALEALLAGLRLGAGTAEATLELERVPALVPLARALRRAASSGAPLAATLVRLADEQRSEVRWQAEARARRVGTLAALPVTLCFLPAFVLVGIVPVVISVGRDVLLG